MSINFSKRDIRDIIKLYTVSRIGCKKIGQLYGVGYKPIKRILTENGVTVSDRTIVEFANSEKESIISAYKSGVGVGGIAECVGLTCSEGAIRRFLKAEIGTLRNRSEQQQARMDRASTEAKRALTRSANIAASGRIATKSEKIKRAKSREGKIGSAKERIVFDFLVKNGFDCTPGKAIDIYNSDICIGNVTVEVFGGGWSVSDKSRIRRYLKRTKEIGNIGYNTIFLIIYDNMTIGDGSELIRSINILSSNPPTASEYRVIWGNREGKSGLSCNIDSDAFVCPFKNVRDPVTGNYISVRK